MLEPMTKEKAIEILGEAVSWHTLCLYSDFWEAVKMALAALHQLRIQEEMQVPRGRRP